MSEYSNTYANFFIQDKNALAEWIVRSLGHPLVTVELTADQIDDSINESVEEYTKYVNQERQYIALSLSDYNETSGFTLPAQVVGIFAVQDGFLSTMSSSEGINSLFSIPNQLWNAGMIPTLGFGYSGTGSWIDFEAAMQYMDLVKRMTGGGGGDGSFHAEFNIRTKSLTLLPNPVKQQASGYVVVGANVIRPATQQYGESWVRRYSLALCKIKLGYIRAKFGGSVQLLGGGNLDTSMKEEGLSEKTELKDELWETEGKVVGNFFVG